MSRMPAKIFVTHQSPLIDETGAQQYVSEVTVDELEGYGRKLIELIKGGIQAFDWLVNQAIEPFRPCSNMQGAERAACLLNKLADSIVVALRRYFVIPLTPPPKEVSIREVEPTPADILYAWSLGRELDVVRDSLDRLLAEEIDYSVVKRFVNSMLSSFREAGLLNLPRDEGEALERLYLLMKLPADTRPGCSMSKLISHKLAVAGLAVAKYVGRRFVKSSRGIVAPNPEALIELGLLRLAALLHDIGKPESWARMYRDGEFVSHAEVSARILEEQLNLRKLFESLGLGALFNALSSLVRMHHAPENLDCAYSVGELNVTLRLRELGDILREADKLASQMDRLGPLFAKVTSDLLKDVAERFGINVEKLYTGTGADVWRAWLSIDEATARKIADRVSEMFKARLIPPELVESQAIGGGTDVKLLVADVGSIQRFIRRESLRAVIAASFAVDLFTQYAVPRAIMEVLGVTLESVMYAGGGMVVAFVPAIVDRALEELVADRAHRILPLDMELYVASVNFYGSWPHAMRLAAAKLGTRKMIRGEPKTEGLALGVEVLCESCGVKPATRRDERGYYLCDECSTLMKLGDEMYVVPRLHTLANLGYDVGQLLGRRSEVLQNLMSWLSGVKLEELGREEYRIALVKIDGNAAGQYMASAANVTEAVLRSIRLDMGIKMGFIEALSALREFAGGRWDDLVARIYVGTLYAGGDDMLAIWPAALALPLSLALAKTFWRINGGAVSLSIAIVASKPKHNVWNVIDAAAELLDRCKNGYRLKLPSSADPKVIAFVAAFKSDAQVFGVDVERTFSENEQYTYQPLVFSLISQQAFGCSDMMSVIGEVLAGCHGDCCGALSSASDLIKLLFRLSLIDDCKRRAGKVSRVVSEVSSSPTGSAGREVLALFLARSALRRSDEFERSVLKGLAKLAFKCTKLPPLFDFYHVFEMMSEGASV